MLKKVYPHYNLKIDLSDISSLFEDRFKMRIDTHMIFSGMWR